MAGAENLETAENPLLSAVAGTFTRNGPVHFAFVPAGEPVDKANYGGGDDLTREWSDAEKAAFRAVMTRFMEVSALELVETVDHREADIQAQIVDNVPGGWAGYAGIDSTFVVSNTSETLLTHEFGHSVGLGHPFDTGFGTTILPGVSAPGDPGDFGFNAKLYTVESYQYGALPEYPGVDVITPTGLMALDIAALQVLYGANEGHRTGDDRYGITDGFRTIWDAGGTDAIDFSPLLTDAVIDLRAASLLVEPGGLGRPSLIDRSELARDVGGYMIAYGVVIENALGGSGDDLLTGNGHGNRLDGAAGDDTLTGGRGDDHLIGGPNAIATVPLALLNDQYASDRALDADAVPMPDSATFDMVLRLDPGGPDFYRVLSYKPLGTDDFHFDVQYSGGTDGHLSVIYKTETGNSQPLSIGIREEEILDGKEHRLTITRDSDTGMVKAYLDGIYQHEREIDPGAAFTPGGTLVFGQSQGVWVPPDSPRAALWGGVGEMAIYDRALDAGEIAAGTMLNLADPNDPRLVAHWRPDPDSGTIATLAGQVSLEPRNVDRIEDSAIATDNDRLAGGAGDDTLIGGGGHDTAVIAVASNDFVAVLAQGGVRVVSEDGADFLAEDIESVAFTDMTLDLADVLSNAVDERVIGGTAGPDSLQGSTEDERILGFSGDDRLRPGGGNDTLDGGPGRDHADFSGRAPSDQATQGGAFLTADLGLGTAQEQAGQRLSLVSIEDLTGTVLDDRLTGDATENVLMGLDGADRLTGFQGNDRIDGGIGADTLNGGDGHDLLTGGPDGHEADQHDVIYAGDGDDRAEGGGGNDQLFGQSGDDTLSGGFGADELHGQEGNDVVTGGALSDLVFGGDGGDFVNGGFGHDRINGGDGADRFFHLGVFDHGADWVQDYDSAEGDVLIFGQVATAEDFQINYAHTATPDGDRSGDDDVAEGFVIYRPTEQVIWALVDGAGQDAVILHVGSDSFDLMA
ncbi:M10 family metallopeptidase C-terminal domain-containing protein [Lutimaribacter marinistellae]|uniref:M10 family metallopeptidase C-terminal domain-containing protein n=1 Tax=Lutimaribacter marinistellae TaxID=1820329 RepID=A0ABV7TEU7_9RHOB